LKFAEGAGLVTFFKYLKVLGDGNGKKWFPCWAAYCGFAFQILTSFMSSPLQLLKLRLLL